MAALTLATLTVLAGGATAMVLTAAAKYDSNVKRIDAGITANVAVTKSQPRVRTHVDGPLTFLVVGSDSRAADPKDPKQFTADGGQRTDTIMLVHLQADQKHGYVVSIPRDTFVRIPAGGAWQGGMGKINAAYQYGGVKLLVQTVEGFTGDHVDHVVIIDFRGIERVVDALGGVNVVVDRTVRDSQLHKTFLKGVNHLNGKAALYYVRGRHGLPGSDFDRIKRQHQFLASMLTKAGSTGTLTNPLKLNAFLNAASKAITVDKDLQLADMAFQMRGLRAGDFTFMTTPIAADARDPTFGAVLIPDHVKASELFAAMSEDAIGAWITANPLYASNPSHGF